MVGQDLFVRILRNALSQNRLGNGLLLTGIRGVGKTTLARLVAKALSCLHRDDQQEPCNVCSSCVAMIQDKHVDILEMDAASHTGVDDIRQILDSCSYKPLLGNYKIYIIDEVHMLSKSAFNALLKTLEEPPAHVKFIFATTDVAKVPLTVVSRCQQLHLHRVPVEPLVQHLKSIAEQEGYGIHEDALALVARYSEGGVRDALSLLERIFLVSSIHHPIDLHSVLSILGLPPTEWLEQLFQLLKQGDGPSMVSFLRTQYHQGSEPITLLNQLMQCIHEKTMHHLNNPSAEPTLSLDRYDQWWQLGHKGLSELAQSPFPLLSLEMVVLRMAYMTHFPTQSQILSFIEPLGPKASSGRPKHTTAGSSADPHQSIQSPALPQHKSRPEKTLPSVVAPPMAPPMASLEDLLLALEQAREGLLHAHVRSNVSWVGWQGPNLVLHWDTTRGIMPNTFSAALSQFFKSHTQSQGNITWGHTAHELSPLAKEEQNQAYYDTLARQDPHVQTILKTFPDATIEQIIVL